MRSVILLPVPEVIDSMLVGEHRVVIKRFKVVRYTVADDAKIRLAQAQRLVGGYVEVVATAPEVSGVLILANEEGRLLDMPPGALRGIVGPVAILGTRMDEDGGEWVGLTEEQEREQLRALGFTDQIPVEDGGPLPSDGGPLS